MRPANVYHPRQADCTALQMYNSERPNSWYHPGQADCTAFRIYNSDDQPQLTYIPR